MFSARVWTVSRTAIAAAAVWVGAAGSAHAATFLVLNAADGGPGSLRQAILDANASPGPDLIDMAAIAGQTIKLAAGQLVISDAVTITAPAPGVTIDAQGASRVLWISMFVQASIRGVTITGGSADIGAGILVDVFAGLSLSDSVVTGNSASLEAGGIITGQQTSITRSTISGNSVTVPAGWSGGGGGILVPQSSSVTITDSTISGNVANGAVGATADGGGILNSGDLMLVNTTISGNSAQRRGGGLANAGDHCISCTPSAYLTFVTIAGNSAAPVVFPGSGGGGVSAFGAATYIQNTILAGSPSGGNCNQTNAMLSFGATFSTDGTCGFGFTQVSSTQLNLGPLGNYGGPTQTHALFAGPAVDAALDCNPFGYPPPILADQRGYPRPQGAACDAGAYEAGLPNGGPGVSQVTLASGVSFSTSSGVFTNIVAVPGPLPNPPANVAFPYGLFNFTIAGVPPKGSATVTITFPTAIAAPAQYWKYNFGKWTDATALLNGSGLDGDNVLTLTLTDGAPEDADGLQNGVISDPGGVGVSLSQTVDIDIEPGGTPNSINPRSRGVIPVAILGSADFDAASVDGTTVRFGPASAADASGGHLEDVNRDGRLDLVLHFDTQAAGIACGQSSATLIGKTAGGKTIQGSDTIRTVGCK